MPDFDHEPIRGSFTPTHGKFNASICCIYADTGRNNTIIARVPKVAQTSIGRTFPAQVPAEKLHLYGKVIVLVRDPLERLESAFNYFTERNSFPTAWRNDEMCMTQHKPKDIDAFIAYILDERWYDKHWIPQSWLWGPDVTENFEFRRFEDYRQVLAEVGGPVLHENRTETKKVGIKYRIPELEELFKPDLDLRETLQ